jgi:urea transport system substrate-binding protein
VGRGWGISPSRLPTISFSISESELSQLANVDMLGDYLAWSYFETVDRPQNKLFVERFKKKYGQYRGISDPMEAAYFGVHLWAQAVRQAGTDEVRAIRRAMQNQSYEAPGSLVRIEPSNNHTWKMFRVGKIVSPTRIDVVFSSEGLLPPEPFPSSRTRAQWEQMLEFFHKQWGGSWVNPQQPDLLRPSKHGGH